jgi:2-oxoisovalerate dehydrogenase E1 component
MPFGDLTVSEGKIVRWLKKVGDPVKAGELVVEIETDKAVVEVEATATGKLAQILEQAGTVVKMGQQIAVVAPV